MKLQHLRKKYFFMTIFLIQIFFLFSCEVYPLYSYKVKGNRKIYKGCGFILSCRSYEEGALDISLVCQKNKDNDYDYFQYWGGNDCDSTLVPELITARFEDSKDTLIFDKISIYEKAIHVSGNYPVEIAKKTPLEVIIKFKNKKPATVLHLKQIKRIYVDFWLLKGLLVH